jgi:hypothetical protein
MHASKGETGARIVVCLVLDLFFVLSGVCLIMVEHFEELIRWPALVALVEE